MTTEWFTTDLHAVTDWRSRWPDDGGDIETYSVRCFHAAVIRLDDDGEPETVTCTHPHSRKSAAQKCAVLLAIQLNTEGARS